jgi:cob(I)alamin adenosyltransferase
MVFLSRIYTKSGDTGETGLGDGSRVSKSHARVCAFGEVDELNSVLGLVVVNGSDEKPLLHRIQNELFDLGADLCVPFGKDEEKALRMQAAQAERLEREIDRLNERLQPLRSFVLPGGTSVSAWLHVARSVCRRAERAMVVLMETEPVNPAALIYLNRLSDLLFVMARVANADGTADILWVPGQSRA